MVNAVIDKARKVKAVVFNIGEFSDLRKQEKESGNKLDYLEIKIDGKIIKQFSRREMVIETIKSQPFF